MQLQMIIGFTVIIGNFCEEIDISIIQIAELGVTCVHLYYFRYITIITEDHLVKVW